MSTDLGSLLREHREEFMAQYGAGLVLQQRRAYDAIARCRTGALGRVAYTCPDCGELHEALCSCGNRHCPLCQGRSSAEWVRAQEAALLPCGYQLVTFTVPEELRPFIYRHQAKAYRAMFDAAEATLRAFLRNPKVLGAALHGFLAVLHTWGGMLQYHPHLHFLVPAGGTDERGLEWKSRVQGLFMKSEALSKVWRAKLLHALTRRVGSLAGMAPQMKEKAFIVHSKPAGTGQQVLRYLARYVFRVAISNDRIIEEKDGKVVFSYRDKETNRYHTTSLPVLEFIRRFMQHILPKGFVKVRHYGFLHPNSRIGIEQLRALIYGFYDAMRDYIPDLLLPITVPPPPTCRNCGATMRARFIARIPIVRHLSAVPSG